MADMPPTRLRMSLCSYQADRMLYMLCHGCTHAAGAGSAPKFYPSGWSPPTDTPLEYPGPFAMPIIDIKWSGLNSQKVQCAQNYPPEAPTNLCGHVSLVELDAQMVYKQALAYWATKDEQYAANVFRVIEGWADANVEFGQREQNGPLEAGWGEWA